MSNVYVIAGPNGAGKTTFARRFLPESVSTRQFVNADLIAAGLSPLSPDSAAIEAGKLMLRRIDALSAQGVDFGFETTLASLIFQRRLRTLKAASYRVHLAFLWLASPELAIARVRNRVEHGGHGVPEPTIRRRYLAGLRNLFDLYLPLADIWTVYDNSGCHPVEVASGVPGGMRVANPAVLEVIRNQLQA